MKSHLIKKYLKDNGIDFYLITNNDLHLNESPNLDLKDIFKLFKFDCTRGYILFFINKFEFFFSEDQGRYIIEVSKKNLKKVGGVSLVEWSIIHAKYISNNSFSIFSAIFLFGILIIFNN